jgi:hypothetical protein
MDLLLVPCVSPIISSSLFPCISAYCLLVFQLIAPLFQLTPYGLTIVPD